MCFWQGRLDHVLPGAKPYYEMLIAAGILAGSPEHAAEMIATRWNRIPEWWEDDTVQRARKTYCDRYAKSEKRPVRTMKKLLTSPEML
jgi:putative transferase (TIGR04331 family)